MATKALKTKKTRKALKTEKTRGAPEALDVILALMYAFAERGMKKGMPTLATGGDPALQRAFEVLEWQDPHWVNHDGPLICEIADCYQWGVGPAKWGKAQLMLCETHSLEAYLRRPMRRPKQYALDRELERIKPKVIAIESKQVTEGTVAKG